MSRWVVMQHLAKEGQKMKLVAYDFVRTKDGYQNAPVLAKDQGSLIYLNIRPRYPILN